jgi:hypothetical protein
MATTATRTLHNHIAYGFKAGAWTVLRYAGYWPGTTEPSWLCRCRCGKQATLRQSVLRSGAKPSCGHPRFEPPEIGEPFGEWTVLEVKGSFAFCRCSCGTVLEVSARLLLRGDSTSCGHERRG